MLSKPDLSASSLQDVSLYRMILLASCSEDCELRLFWPAAPVLCDPLTSHAVREL